MVWGTEGTPTVAACNLPGQWSEQARTKASLFASRLENQCASCVLVSLPFSWLKGRMLVQQYADSFQGSTHSGDLPAYHITLAILKRAQVYLSELLQQSLTEGFFINSPSKPGPYYVNILSYFLDSYSNKLCAKFFFIIDGGLERRLFPARLGNAGVALWAAYVMVYEEVFSSYS